MKTRMDQTEKRRRGRPRSFHAPSEANAIQSLDRALKLLAVVAASDGLSLSETAAASALPASTVYRMLTTLQAHGIVELDEPAQLWSVGVEAFRIGTSFLRRRRLADRARAIMQRLLTETGETANLGVAEDDCVVFVGQVETHEAIRAFFRPGTRSPFHASGIGKAVLAFMPQARVAEIVRRHGLEVYTDRTLASHADLADDLARTRARGYALDDEERFAGMRCIAAAVFNEFGEPIGGVSISGPTVRVTRERVGDLGAKVARAAAEITRAIGGLVPEAGA